MLNPISKIHQAYILALQAYIWQLNYMFIIFAGDIWHL